MANTGNTEKSTKKPNNSNAPKVVLEDLKALAEVTTLRETILISSEICLADGLRDLVEVTVVPQVSLKDRIFLRICRYHCEKWQLLSNVLLR